jgi:hypothetical protein
MFLVNLEDLAKPRLRLHLERWILVVLDFLAILEDPVRKPLQQYPEHPGFQFPEYLVFLVNLEYPVYLGYLEFPVYLVFLVFPEYLAHPEDPANPVYLVNLAYPAVL